MTETPEPIATQVDWAERRHARSVERRKSSRSRHVWIAVAGVAIVLSLLVAVEAATSVGRIHPGVTVAGVPVGGMSPEKATLALSTQLPALASEQPVTVIFADKEWSFSSADAGVAFDTTATVDSAMKVGREGGILASLGKRLSSWFGGTQVVAVTLAAEEQINPALDKIAEGTDIAPVDARVEVSGTKTAVVPGKDGRALQRVKARQAILAAFTAKNRRVEAPVGVAKVKITDAEAEAARATAEKMISAPITVTYDKKKWTFDEAQIASWIAFKNSDEIDDETAAALEESGSLPVASAVSSTTPAEVTLFAFIAAEKAGKTVLPAVGSGIGRPAQDARFKTAGGKVKIIPSQEGIGPDIDSLSLILTKQLAQPSAPRVFELRTNRTTPNLTTEQAQEMGVSERISTYTTTFSSGNAPRVNNIHTLGDKLDGTLIRPGETFSFNGSVGERTAARGYKEANAIVNGKLVPQLGGGICQVGTTLFNTVFESGLPVAERKNHSFYISHYPKGRDATVSWGGPDFKFKNDTKNYVLLSVGYTNSSITISLYGTDPGYKVESKTGPWRDERAFPTEEIKDPSMPVGSKVVEDSGVTGRSVTVERIVSKDGEVVRTDKFVSVYKPKVQVVRVGTKPKTPKPATPATSTPKP